MRNVILGAAGFLGTNLAKALSLRGEELLLVDRRKEWLNELEEMELNNAAFSVLDCTENTDFTALLRSGDMVYHLLSTSTPGTSDVGVARELRENVVMTAGLLEACAECGVGRIVFLSSGGTVYGRNAVCPIREDAPADPICSYGVQKLAIEKLLYCFHSMRGLDYRIIRLSNPYGPHQRPSNNQGLVANIVSKALHGEPIPLYGDGSVIRDYIYVDDAVRGILNVADSDCGFRLFNLGTGRGTSVKDMIDAVAEVFGCMPEICRLPARPVDVPCNYLDIGRYESVFGKAETVDLREGIRRTVAYQKEKETKKG